MALTDKLTNIANAIREKTGSTRTMNLEEMAVTVTNIKIPTALSDLNEDETHRTVTDAEKKTWNNKSNFSGNYDDLKNKPTIPTIPEKLPNPNALTFTGAVTGSYDGSAPVSVNIPEGGSGEAWELIDSVTLSENVAEVTFNFDTPYKKILFMCQPNVSVSGWKRFSINNGVSIPCANIAISSTHALFIEIGAFEKRPYQAKDNRVLARARITVEQISDPQNGTLDTYDGNLWVDIAGVYFGSKSAMEINSIAMKTAEMCVAGAYFEVWGVKA